MHINVKDHHWINIVYNVGQTMDERWTNDNLPALYHHWLGGQNYAGPT